MILGIFSSQYRSEGKALAAVSIVSNGDQIGIRVIADGVDTRHLSATDMINTQELLVRRILLPSLLTVDIFHNFIGQCDSRTTGMIELMHMVRLLHLHIILWELVHNLGQISVHSREDGYADGEV